MEYLKKATDSALLDAFLSGRPIEFIRLVVVDFSGITRERFLKTAYCRKVFKGSGRYGLSPLITYINISGTGEGGRKPKQQKYELVPDWFSLRECKFSPGHAWVMCFIRTGDEEEPFAYCPRFLLAKVLERVAKEPVGDILTGFEVEFSLLDEALQPLQDNDRIENWSTAAGLRGKKLSFMEDVVRTLESSGIEVTHFHAEAFQQLEFATEPYGPMLAADNLIYTHELLRTIAVKNGYCASVSTKPIPQAPPGIYPGNVCHVHFSISNKDESIADQFLAGVLSRLPAITSIALPTYDSYLNPDFNQKGVWVSYGTENRDVAIRRIANNHWELRTVDASMNSYMLLAVLLSSGLDGIQNQQILESKDLSYYPRDLTDEELASMGVTERLPNNLKDALNVFRASDEMGRLLGEQMKQAYLYVKDTDEEAFSQMDEEQRRRLYIRYF